MNNKFVVLNVKFSCAKWAEDLKKLYCLSSNCPALFTYYTNEIN